jgi:hypothetical protein
MRRKGQGTRRSVGMNLAHYGRAKTSALLVVRSLVTLPHAPGLSQTLPADYSDFGLRLNRLNRYAGLQTARIIRLWNPGERKGGHF